MGTQQLRFMKLGNLGMNTGLRNIKNVTIIMQDLCANLYMSGSIS